MGCFCSAHIVNNHMLIESISSPVRVGIATQINFELIIETTSKQVSTVQETLKVRLHGFYALGPTKQGGTNLEPKIVVR
ncbi:hypothetical protein L596_009943 [Steinernema carpocapsae]|uniref:Uncharacterized protein n=1 Tax=Steinernema carpocapsae TaxID=34508 RepID=A0A4V6A6Q7_STECR|nr:hypothetical protein L596_009943 [Steinernema carpocapsae]